MAGALSTWLAQLPPLGVLVLEETEGIQTGSAVFRSYLALAERLLATRGAALYPVPPWRSSPRPHRRGC